MNLDRFARTCKPGCVSFVQGLEGLATLFNFTELRKCYPPEVVAEVDRAIRKANLRSKTAERYTELAPLAPLVKAYGGAAASPPFLVKREEER